MAKSHRKVLCWVCCVPLHHSFRLSLAVVCFGVVRQLWQRGFVTWVQAAVMQSMLSIVQSIVALVLPALIVLPVHTHLVLLMQVLVLIVA